MYLYLDSKLNFRFKSWKCGDLEIRKHLKSNKKCNKQNYNSA